MFFVADELALTAVFDLLNAAIYSLEKPQGKCWNSCIELEDEQLTFHSEVKVKRFFAGISRNDYTLRRNKIIDNASIECAQQTRNLKVSTLFL